MKHEKYSIPKSFNAKKELHYYTTTTKCIQITYLQKRKPKKFVTVQHTLIIGTNE
jgi:hypothetical protein